MGWMLAPSAAGGRSARGSKRQLSFVRTHARNPRAAPSTISSRLRGLRWSQSAGQPGPRPCASSPAVAYAA